MKFATKPYDITHLTLGVLLQYLGKLKIKISADIQPIWKTVQAYCILVTFNFVIRPQILIFSVLKNGVSFAILIANKIFHVTFLLVIYFCDQICGIENSLFIVACLWNNLFQFQTWLHVK